MITLFIDTSTTTLTVALIKDGIVLEESTVSSSEHSKHTMPEIEKLFKNNNIEPKSVNKIMVTNGPGSFTGIRIGVSLVKGLSDPLNKKCVPVSTLEAIAKPLENTGVIAASVMDARCNQVYCALFDCAKNEMKRLTDDDAISIDELTEQLKNQEKKVVLIGDGANICYKRMKDILENVSIASANIRYQSASSVALIAEDLILKDENNAVSSSELVPKYLRLSQAERELKKKQENN